MIFWDASLISLYVADRPGRVVDLLGRAVDLSEQVAVLYFQDELSIIRDMFLIFCYVLWTF